MSDSFLDKNKKVEEIFNAFQYIALKIVGNVSEIHSFLIDGDIQSCRENIEEIKNLQNLMEKAINSIEEFADENSFSEEDNEENEEYGHIDDFLDEDFSEDISEEELNSN